MTIYTEGNDGFAVEFSGLTKEDLEYWTHTMKSAYDLEVIRIEEI